MNPFDNNVPDLDAGDIVRNKRDKTIYKSAQREFVSAKGKKTQFYKDASIKSVNNYQTKQSLLRGNALCDPSGCNDFKLKITQGNNASSTFDGSGIVVVRTDASDNILAVLSSRSDVHGYVSGVVIDPSSNLFPIDECDKPGWKKLIDISGNCLLKNTKQGYLHYLGDRSRKFKMFSGTAVATPPTYLYGKINSIPGSSNLQGSLIMTFTKPVLIPANPGSNPSSGSFFTNINNDFNDDNIVSATFDSSGNVNLIITKEQNGIKSPFKSTDIVEIFYITHYQTINNVIMPAGENLPKIGDSAGNLVETFPHATNYITRYMKPVQNNLTDLTPIPNAIANNREKGIKMILDIWLVTPNNPDIIQYGHIEYWDTSQVTDMSQLFDTSDNLHSDVLNAMVVFNEDISRWNVENVTNFQNFGFDPNFENPGIYISPY